MWDLIPALLILVFFGVSLLVGRFVGRSFRIFLGIGLMIYFTIMFFIATENRYPYLFCVIMSSLFILRARPSKDDAKKI